MKIHQNASGILSALETHIVLLHRAFRWDGIVLESLNAIDHAISLALMGFTLSHGWLWSVNQFIQGAVLFKGVALIVMAFFAYAHRTQASQSGKLFGTPDLFLLRTSLAIGSALFLGRVMQKFLMFRSRPIAEHGVIDAPWVENLSSSFPSDHAILMCCIASAIYYLNKKIGILAFVWTALIVLTPRALLGLHYPSDLIVGALIGIGFFIIFMKLPAPSWAHQRAAQLEERYPTTATVLAFLMVYFSATGFIDLRHLVSALTG